MNDEDDDLNTPIDFHSFGCGDPHCHIQALEGAIKGAILHLESVHPILAAKVAWNGDQWAALNTQVIANLKELIGEK